MRNSPLKIFFDGGCRPNPGKIETAVVARGISYIRNDCGVGDSNDAEWLALIHAAEIALSLGEYEVIMLGDSACVVGHASGASKCGKPRFRAYLDQFHALAAGFTMIRVRRIARNQNLAGIKLAQARL